VQAAAEMGLHLPKPNPFIPEDLSLRELPAEPPKLPVALDAAVPPVSCIFHRQDDVFRQPKAHVVFHIFSPYATQDAENFLKVELWCRAVEEALNEYAYDATVAGVSYALGMRAGFISLAVAGFNDKLGVLLAAVTEKMRSLTEVPDNIYSIVADAYADEIRNQAFHSPPYAQCTMRFNELATRGMTFPSYIRYKAFQSLKREDLSNMAEQIFGACHVEAVVLGNMNAEDARVLAGTLAKGLCLEKPLPSLPVRSEAVLPDGRTLWVLPATNADDPNHAVFLRIQLRASLEADMSLNLLNKVLSPKFFDIVRTQQQLGYIVQLATNASAGFCYLLAVVQSEFPPDYVRSRIDAFLDEHFTFVSEALTEEEFEVCRAGLLSELRMKPKNLVEELSRYQRHFSDRTYDFERRRRAISFVESQASLDDLRRFLRESVLPAPRLYTQVRKLLAKEDKALPEGASVPSDPAELQRWESDGDGGHRPTVEAFSASTTWFPLSSAVA